MAEILHLTDYDPRHCDARQVLLEAMEMNPQSVIVFAFGPEGITVCASASIDRLKIIGALEAAKMKIWQD